MFYETHPSRKLWFLCFQGSRLIQTTELFLLKIQWEQEQAQIHTIQMLSV